MMQSNTSTTGAILDGLLPMELRADAGKLASISTDSDYSGSATRYMEQTDRARKIYSRMFFEPDFAHRSPSVLLLAQYYVSRRDWTQSALQLYTSAKNSRIPVKKLPFGAELIDELDRLNEIVNVITDRVTAEKRDLAGAWLKMRDNLRQEVKGLVERVTKAAGGKSGKQLPGNTAKASEGLFSQRVLSSEEVSVMLGNIAMTAESVAKSVEDLPAYHN
jgi:hypothetical protein